VDVRFIAYNKNPDNTAPVPDLPWPLMPVTRSRRTEADADDPLHTMCPGVGRGAGDIDWLNGP
jgi:hypothetical protein